MNGIERLTGKQALFVSEYLKNGGNATQAYLKAGYNVKNERVACTNASRLLTNAKIARAIAKRQSERNNRLQLEEDYELKEAMRLLRMCSQPKVIYNFDGSPLKNESGQYVFAFDSKGANTALQTICRLRGKFIEKKQLEVAISDRSEWLSDALKEISEGGGNDA